jgi:Tfp pilus assembly protein PilF
MRARTGSARARSGLRAAAAAIAAAAVLQAGVAAGHESHRHRSQWPSRAGIAAADEAQSRHDFATASAELDRLLAADPRDLEARLMRANLRLLAGDYEASRRDCRAALATGGLYAGTVCAAAAQTGPGSVGRARGMLAALGDDTAAGLELRRWRLLTEADLAARADDARAAAALLERAHALDPAHEEARTLLAGLLMDLGDARRALDVARAPQPSPARQVVLIRAALALGDPRAAPWRRELEAALESDRRSGIPPHLREEGQIALYLDDDAASALTLARQNFATQRDTRDLRLLADAAAAAGDQPALDTVRAWMTTSGFEDRAVLRRTGGAAQLCGAIAVECPRDP